MYGIYADIGGILMVNVTIYSIHGSYGIKSPWKFQPFPPLDPTALLGSRPMAAVWPTIGPDEDTFTVLHVFFVLTLARKARSVTRVESEKSVAIFSGNQKMHFCRLAQLCNPAKGSCKVPGLFRFFGACIFVSPIPRRDWHPTDSLLGFLELIGSPPKVLVQSWTSYWCLVDMWTVRSPLVSWYS